MCTCAFVNCQIKGINMKPYIQTEIIKIMDSTSPPLVCVCGGGGGVVPLELLEILK